MKRYGVAAFLIGRSPMKQNLHNQTDMSDLNCMGLL